MQPVFPVVAACPVMNGTPCFPLACLAIIVAAFLLMVWPLMMWLNVRRLRHNLHADLTALRESVDRLAGVAPAVVQAPSAEIAEAPAPEALSPAETPAPDKIGFSCPECGKFFEGPTSLAGTTFACPECHVEFHIH